MQSTAFEVIVGVLIALAVVGTIVSAVAVYRRARRPRAARTGIASDDRRLAGRTLGRSDREPQHRRDAAVVGEQLRILDEGDPRRRSASPW